MYVMRIMDYVTSSENAIRTNIRNFKLKPSVNLPTYLDGRFKLFRLTQVETEDYPIDTPIDTGITMFYQELTIFDRLRLDSNQRGIELTMKLRIPQYKAIDTLCVLEIQEKKHKVFNVAHFTDPKDGFKKTDITLTRYKK